MDPLAAKDFRSLNSPSNLSSQTASTDNFGSPCGEALAHRLSPIDEQLQEHLEQLLRQLNLSQFQAISKQKNGKSEAKTTNFLNKEIWINFTKLRLFYSLEVFHYPAFNFYKNDVLIKVKHIRTNRKSGWLVSSL